MDTFFQTRARLTLAVKDFQRFRESEWDGKTTRQASEWASNFTRQSWILLAFGELASGYPHPCRSFTTFCHARRNSRYLWTRISISPLWCSLPRLVGSMTSLWHHRCCLMPGCDFAVLVTARCMRFPWGIGFLAVRVWQAVLPVQL
jgi:hypothetical protein